MGMEISISEYNHKRIQRKMESGLYRSPDDMISIALGLLERLEADLERELADMYERVRIGTEQADAGMLIPGSEAKATVILSSSLR